MSKDTKVQPKFSLEGLGFSGLDSSPVVQQVKQKAATERADTLFPYDATDKIGIISGDQAASEYQSALDKGYQLYGDTKKVDQTLGEAQSTGEQFGTAIARFAPMTALKLVESISSLAAGVKYLGTGETDWMDPSAGWNQYLKQVDEQIRTALPIHATKEYDEGTIGDQLLSSKFWTDDASDGLQFLVAQVLGSKGLGAAANLTGKGIGAAAELANLSALYKAVPVTQKIATAVANNFNTGTVGFLNTVSNAALQAKDTGLQIEAALRNRYGSEVNPDTGDYYTGQEIDNKIAKHRDTIDGKIKNTFWATAAVGLLPELYEAKLILGAGKAHMGQYSSDIMKAVNEGKISLADLEKGVGTDVLRKTGWKSALKEGTKAAAVEGLWEENMENAIQSYDKDQALAGQHDNVWDSKFGYLAQFLDNFTDKDGLKAIILGSLMGGLMGGVAGVREAHEYNEGLDKHLNSMQAADNLFAPAIESIYKTDKDGKIQIDDEGNPVEDTENLSKLMFQMLSNKNNWDNQTAAALSGNRVAATLNENLALGQSIARELQSDRYSTVDEAREYFKWFHGQRIKEQGMEAAKEAADDEVVDSAEQQSQNPDDAAANGTKVRSAMKTGSAQGDANLSVKVSNNSKLVDSMFDMWETSGKQADRLTKLGQDSSRTAFNDNVRRALYYESIKRESLRETVKEKEAEIREVGADREAINNQIISINDTIADSEKRTSDFLNKPDELYKGWAATNANRKALLEGSINAAERYDKEKTDVNNRSAQTADYMLQEHAAKEGAADSGNADTDAFLTNQPIADRSRVPISMRNEFNWKAGNDYLKMSRLRTMMDQVRSGELPLHEAVNYATDSITRLDDATRKELQQLITDEKVKIAADEQKLATMPDFDEETMEFNPEYQELEQKIEKNKEAVASSINVLEKAAKADELNMLNQRPDRIEETLNRRFAEEQLQRGENVISNATEDGAVKDTYTDARSVNNAIAQVTRMRDALEDRTDKGDLKGQTQYNYLIAKADKMLAELQKVANAVVDNKLKRDGIQASIAQRQASSNALALGFDLDTNSVVSEAVFNMTDQILKGKLKDMLAQVKSMDSGNFYEGTMSILHAVKTAASAEDMNTLRDLMEEQIDSLIATVPDPKVGKHWKTGLAKSPELYVAGLVQSLYADNGSALDKGQPLATYNSNNDIDELESRFSAMPDDADGLDATSRSNILTAVKAAKQIIAIERVKNLLNSTADLHKSVTDEIKLATEGNGVVPTAQQEIAIRDGLAWLSSNSPVNGEKFSGWAFLRGIAGTGKTSVTVKWILNLSGLKTDEILATAATDRAAKVLGDATDTQATTVEALMEGTIPSDKKLIVIDEYARVPREQLDIFEKMVREHNKNQSPADRVRVLILGDPTQITPLTFSNQDITQPGSNRSAGNIRVINPLTVVYRSEVSAVNEASDIFQANSKPVESINVRADKPMGAALTTGVHTSKSAQDIFDIVRTNMKTEQDNGLTPRTRVVIASDTAKYAALGIPVISVYDAQSETYQEVYVDLDPNDFNSTEKFNTAMYTAASRAKEYTYLRYDNGVNTVDPGLSREKENNDQVGREAKGDYIKARAEEKLMMEKAVKGESINVPKTEMAVKVAKEQTAFETDLNPKVDENTSDRIATVSDTDQQLPPDEAAGNIDPDTGAQVEIPITVIDKSSLVAGQRMLPNINKGVFQALWSKATGSRIGIGSPVVHMHTREANGEDSVTTFAFDKDNKWIPISKVFSKELDTSYPEFKDKVSNSPAMPITDPQQLNGSATKQPVSLQDMKASQVGEGTISHVQRLTYIFDQEPVSLSVPLAKYIKDIFKSQFYSKTNKDEQKKADRIILRIFRDNEFSGKNSHKFGSFTPEVGIPYAILNPSQSGSDWTASQFIRLTANRLSNQSTYYEAINKCRELAKAVENELPGVSPGKEMFGRFMRAAKAGLEIEHVETAEGTVPKVRLSEDFNSDEFIKALKQAWPSDREFVDPFEGKTSDEIESLIPKLQNLASMIYGVKQGKATVVPSELDFNSGYEHMPFSKESLRQTGTNEAGEEVYEKEGYAVRKNGNGYADDFLPDWYLDPEKGEAQIALNHLAKANEFVGNVRIRVNKPGKRGSIVTGKSLLTDKGGDSREYYTRLALQNILGETEVAAGNIRAEELDRDEVQSDLRDKLKKALDKEPMSAQAYAEKVLSESSVPEDRQAELLKLLGEALETKDTLPIDMAALDLLTNPENYDANGEHLTKESFTIQTPDRGRGVKPETKTVQTYLRTPLDIEQFNGLGKNPEANAEDLSKLVSTKFKGILPTEIGVIDKGAALSNPTQDRIEEIAVQAATMSPGKERELLLEEQAALIAARDEKPEVSIAPAAGKGRQERIEELRSKLEREEATKEERQELRRLVKERDDTSRFFDSQVRKGNTGKKISVSEAITEIKRLVPNITDNEMRFLSRSLMIELERPGESLLGLFQKGQIILREDDDTVSANVLRHEVFHKIFNDYLNDRERATIMSEFDPDRIQSPTDVEEALADRFMLWQKAPETATGKLKRIFQRILNWIGLSNNNGSAIEQLFNDIEEGKFTNPDPFVADTRMAYSDIRKWGSAQDYKNASRFLQNRIFQHFIDDHIDNIPLTQEELFETVRTDLKDTSNGYKKENATYTRAVEKLQTQLSAETDESAREEIAEEIEDYQIAIAENAQQIAMLDRFGEPGLFKGMWKDLYPNYKIVKKPKLSDPAVDDPEDAKTDPSILERNEQEGEEARSSSIMADHIQQSDEKNQETKASHNVKNFLSYIFRPQVTGRNRKGATRVSPASAYLQSLRSLAGVRTSKDIVAQLATRAADMGINVEGNSDSSLVLNHLLDLYNKATGEIYYFGGQRDTEGRAAQIPVELPRNARFLNEDTFILDTNPSADLSDLTEAKGQPVVIQRDKRSTVEFLAEVASLEIITPNQVKGYFRQMQAQQVLREVVSTFASQREGVPMIAEEERNYGKKTQKYFKARMSGVERVKSIEITNAIREGWDKLDSTVWQNFKKAKSATRGTAVAELLEALGVTQADHLKGLDNYTIQTVYKDLSKFDEVIKQVQEEQEKGRLENASDTDEDSGSIDSLGIALDNSSSMLNRITKLLKMDGTGDKASSFQNVKGEKRYIFHLSNQAQDTVNELIRFYTTEGKDGAIPSHLKDDPILSKNIFADGLNKVLAPADHDGMRVKGNEEFATVYRNETPNQWLARNFSYAYLAYMEGNASNNDQALTYIQNFYTISNRPRMSGAVVEVLPESKIKEAIGRAVEQHLLQPDRTDIKNYDRFKAVNFDEFHKALEELYGERLGLKVEGKPDRTIKETVLEKKSRKTEYRASLAKLYEDLSSSDEMRAAVIEHINKQLNDKAESAMQRMKAENVTISKDASRGMSLLVDKRRSILPEGTELPKGELNGWPADELMRPIVENFYKNNYINSFFLNQAVAGNMNFFKDALDMVKRMSGVFAPGTKGMIGKFFMSPKFKVSIVRDLQLAAPNLSEVFKGTALERAVQKTPIDIADAQALMTPARSRELSSGFGQAYVTGAVFKPAHFEVTERNGVSSPVMLKDSSAVISDSIAERFPKLEAARNAMEAQGISEMVFNTGVKAGAPTIQAELPAIIDYENNEINFHPDTQIELSNENYRLQLNPSHEAFDETANPTQMGYFLNTLHNAERNGTINAEIAKSVYEAMAEKFERGLNKLGGILDSKGRVTSKAIVNALSGVGNERAQEMIAAGITPNMPSIADKIVIQIGSIIEKATVKIRLPGGKMTLQSSFGFDIPAEIKPQHDKFWSEYGKAQSADLKKLQKRARRLEYKTDPVTGRLYAEVILPGVYKDKANPGDYLMPEILGFRIPSTGMNSGVALKVVGYYDMEGSNVIVAPAELVALHGSDFDVDSLYIIVREQASKDHYRSNGTTFVEKGQPVGYYRGKNNKYEFNSSAFESELAYEKLQVADDSTALAALEELHDAYLNNKITEGFIDSVSHKENIERMTTPISTQPIADALKELEIDELEGANLSDLQDNLAVYNSNFQGSSLIAMFANGAKSIAYSLKAGVNGKYPALNPKSAFEWNGKTYDQLTEGANTWSNIEAKINTSADNVKEQKLYLMNATDKTAAAYIVAEYLDMPLVDQIRLMLQPVVKQFSATAGGRDTTVGNLKKAIVLHAKGLEIINEGEGYENLREAVKHIEPDLSEKALNKRIKNYEDGTEPNLGRNIEELAQQMAVLDKFEKLNQIGQDLSTFSAAIKVLQEMPAFYQDISMKEDQWKIINTAINDPEADFSFTLPNLLQSQPNIAAAYKVFQWQKTVVDNTMIKHSPEWTALADQLAKETSIRLSSKPDENREMLKSEIMAYMLSSFYSSELKQQAPVEIPNPKKKGEKLVLTGKQAWSEEFSVRVEQAKKADPENPFLYRLAVEKKAYGRVINFISSSNPDPEEVPEMQEGFEALTDETLKKDFVKYAALNYGMSFGLRNYSNFIPSNYLTEISDFIEKDIAKMRDDTKIDTDGTIISGPLRNIRDNLAINLAVNNIDSIGYIDHKKTPAIKQTDAEGKVMEVKSGDRMVPVLSGYNGTYYWNRSYENKFKDNGKPENERAFPEFIHQRDGMDREVVYRRLNDPMIDETIYYQRVGFKNYTGGYNANPEIISKGYNADEYFAQGRIPVPVADVRVKEYEARNEHIQEGSSVIVYPFSNATREEGIVGIVDKVKKGLGSDKILFTLRQDSTPDTSTEHQRLMDIAEDVTSKFGLLLATDTTMQHKGRFENGVVYLNPDLITRDTVYHEVSHPLIAAIAKQNPAWYQNLTAELNESTEGRAIMRKVKAKYPELSKEAQEAEALVTAVGLEAANRLPESTFRNLVRRLMRSIGNLVRTVMNEIKSTGTISLNTIAAEDMAKLTIGDIADILAAKDVKLNLGALSDTDTAQYSKDLGDEKPEKSSVMANILAKAEEIGEPTRDESGQEGDTYPVNGQGLLRVSKLMDKFTFRDKTTPNGPDGKPISTIDAIAKRDADRMFKNVAPGGKLIIDGIERTKQEYEDDKRKIQLQARIKGDIIHARIQKQLAINQGEGTKALELTEKIEELSRMANKEVTAYDWVVRSNKFGPLMLNAGVHIDPKLPKAQQDKIFPETKVASPLLGAGKIDMLVERPDGRLRIVDWKTGSRLKDKYSATILKYGVQENRITDNPLDRAKLQVMMYALMIKAENPTARFDGLVVMHLPNEFEATQARNALSVEVPDYLRMIEQYYRNEEPEVYRQLVEQSPRLFDPREYNAPLNADFAQEVFNSNGMTEAEYYNKLQLDLQKLEVSIAMAKNEDGDGPTKEQRKLRADLLRKIQQGSDYNATNFDGALDPAFEIGLMKRWLGNLEDVHNPYVQNLVSHLRVNEDKAYKEIANNFRQFDKLLEPVITEKIGKRTGVKKALTAVDYAKLWANFYTETRTADPETGTEYVRRGATVEGSEAWKRMTKAEQELSVFMRKNMADIYEDVMVSGNLAIVGKKLDGKPTTKQDLYNASRRGANFKYEPDFMPRLVVSKEEVNFKLRKQIGQGNFSALSDYAKDAWLRFSSDFFDNNAEGYNQKDYGLPVRYLGNANTYGSPESYSMNIEDGYKKYMEQMIRKKHLDSTYMVGQAVKGILESTNDGNGDPAFKQAAGLVDYQLKNILLGESIKKNDKLSRTTSVIRRKDGKEYSVSLLKTYRSMKGGFAAATLWLAPERSFLNAAQATYMVGKETLVNSLPGLKPEERDLSKGEHYSSYKDAMAGMLAAASGKGNQDFRHQLAKELRLYGDLEEEGGKRNEYLTKGSTLLDTSNFGFMYKVPEEITNLQYGFNLLKNLKVQSGKYKGKSMFEMYKDSFNPATGTFELPADFKRGLIEKGDGSFEELKGIHPLEINKIHVGIKKIKGGYRKSEKTAIQGTILGDAFMMFKRWIPALAIQQYQSKFNDPTIGQFELSKIGDELKQKDGEPVYEWRARIVEGRFKTVFNVMLNFAGMNKNAGYNWSDLSGEQKKALYDVGISMVTWMGMVGFGAFAFDDDKEDDSLRKLTENLTGRYIEQWWAPNMLSAAMQEPAVLKRTMDAGKAFWQISLAGTEAAMGGDEKDIYTQRGDIKGMNQLMKNIPFLNSYYEIDRFYDNYESGSTWDSVSPF